MQRKVAAGEGRAEELQGVDAVVKKPLADASNRPVASPESPTISTTSSTEPGCDHKEVSETCRANERKIIWTAENWKEDGWTGTEKKPGGIMVSKKEGKGREMGFLARSKINASPQLIMRAIHDARVLAPQKTDFLEAVPWTKIAEEPGEQDSTRCCRVFSRLFFFEFASYHLTYASPAGPGSWWSGWIRRPYQPSRRSQSVILW